jgi:hypothetical protein
MRTGPLFRVMLTLCAMLMAATVAGQTTLKSPQTVKTGLRILNQVVGHTGRLIASKNYDQVPREAGEFADGVAVLREGLAGERAAFKSTVEPLIDAALKASNAMGDAAKAGNESALNATHEKFAAAVKSVVEAFPEELRPKPRPGMPGGPPPGAH